MPSKQENLGNAQRSYSISLIRFISLLFIVTCHIQQYLNIELAWWFNVGVQLFLCISGFLYGQRDIGEITQFYKKRLTKISIPYYIVFLAACILEILFARGVFSIKSMVAGLIYIGAIKGGEHLWFVRYILLCYILTPLLQEFRQRAKDTRSMWVFAVVSVAICSVWFHLFNRVFNAAWMTCYVLGYMLGTNEKGQYVGSRFLLIVIGLIAVIGNGIQIYCSYIAHNSFSRYQYFCDYNHAFLGAFLFLLFKNMFDRISYFGKLKQVLDITDKYSYETYLVHQFFILGPFTLMRLTPMIGINIGVIIVCIVISAWLLKKAEQFVEGILLVRTS